MLDKQQRAAIRERAEACKVPWVSDVFRVVKTDIPALLDTCDALEAAIKKHRDQKADDRCHLDDNELYAAAGLEPADNTIKDPAEMLENCKRFIECRMQKGGEWKSYQELEAELAAVRAEADERDDWVNRACQLRENLDAALAVLREVANANNWVLSEFEGITIGRLWHNPENLQAAAAKVLADIQTGDE